MLHRERPQLYQKFRGDLTGRESPGPTAEAWRAARPVRTPQRPPGVARNPGFWAFGIWVRLMR